MRWTSWRHGKARQAGRLCGNEHAPSGRTSWCFLALFKRMYVVAQTRFVWGSYNPCIASNSLDPQRKVHAMHTFVRTPSFTANHAGTGEAHHQGGPGPVAKVAPFRAAPVEKLQRPTLHLPAGKQGTARRSWPFFGFTERSEPPEPLSPTD
jgi:hypothetical protein